MLASIACWLVAARACVVDAWPDPLCPSLDPPARTPRRSAWRPWRAPSAISSPSCLDRCGAKCAWPRPRRKKRWPASWPALRTLASSSEPSPVRLGRCIICGGSHAHGAWGRHGEWRELHGRERTLWSWRAPRSMADAPWQMRAGLLPLLRSSAACACARVLCVCVCVHACMPPEKCMSAIRLRGGACAARARDRIIAPSGSLTHATGPPHHRSRRRHRRRRARHRRRRRRRPPS